MNASLNALRRMGFCGLISTVAIFWATAASASTITGVTMFGTQAGTGPGMGTVAVPAIVTGQPNNDNVPSPAALDNSLLVPVKRFEQVDYIDIEFLISPSGGTSEYQVFESVDNSTGVPWNEYKMVLGFGVGANFHQSLIGDGLDFDLPDLDTPPVSSAMPNLLVLDEDHFMFFGGIQGTGSQTYQVRIDVPDFLMVAPFAGGGGITPPTSFTLRQIPVPIPEPSALVLLSMAFAGFAAFRSRG